MPNFQGQCCHDHDCTEANCSTAYSLFKHIDLTHVTCLNESEIGSCLRVFRTWDKRTDFSAGSLSSNEDDAELLLNIPFTGTLAIKAICVIGGTDGTSPSRMRAYINRDDLDFAMVNDLAPLQEWDLQEDFRGILEYPTNAAKFKGVHKLTLHFPENYGSDCTEILFIGLKGEYSERQRKPVTAVYEARPMPEDHKIPGENQNLWKMGM